jgi:hypothetical protein
MSRTEMIRMGRRDRTRKPPGGLAKSAHRKIADAYRRLCGDWRWKITIGAGCGGR